MSRLFKFRGHKRLPGNPFTTYSIVLAVPVHRQLRRELFSMQLASLAYFTVNTQCSTATRECLVWTQQRLRQARLCITYLQISA